MPEFSVPQELVSIDHFDAGGARKRVTVLGAGAAGLVVAYELSRLGHEVTVIEANDRIGGRIWTKRFDNGDHHELGAMRIPRVHTKTHYYVDLFGLKTRTFVNHHDDIDTFYHFRGLTSTHAEWSWRLKPEYQLSAREKVILRGVKAPPLELFSVMKETIEEITNKPEHLAALFATGPMTDFVARLDSLTLYQYLKDKLDTEDAVELLGAATGLEVWWEKAASFFVREEIAMAGNTGFNEIVGGTDQLTGALKSALDARPNVNFRICTEVRKICNQSRGVQLELLELNEDNQKTELVTADLVVCTIPFSVLRQMHISGVSEAKRRAIRNLTYASAAKVLFSCSERFWETKYGILGGGSQFDLINRQVYYPSDFDNIAETPTLTPGSLYTSYAEDRRRKPATVTVRSGALVGSYVWGQDARRLGALPEKERARVVAECVAAIHPEILEEGIIQDHCSVFWDEEKWSAGAFCFMRPLDLQLYYHDTIKNEDRLYFAGEHCSLDQAWIQGAIDSAWRAVLEIVARRD
ncbi:flavin monoamine oxidase family protein [Roseibium album]|uniref:flavin monoamine oxidase family protein n=1 Tax=Roseibium album TaxID=311410 RepID=UPI003299BD9A